MAHVSRHCSPYNTESNYKMDAKRAMGNSNFEIIIAKYETTVSNPEIRKR